MPRSEGTAIISIYKLKKNEDHEHNLLQLMTLLLPIMCCLDLKPRPPACRSDGDLATAPREGGDPRQKFQKPSVRGSTFILSSPPREDTPQRGRPSSLDPGKKTM